MRGLLILDVAFRARTSVSRLGGQALFSTSTQSKRKMRVLTVGNDYEAFVRGLPVQSEDLYEADEDLPATICQSHYVFWRPVTLKVPKGDESGAN
jgi:hypothetical protein